ncbi:MAG: CpaF family protein [Candidatus Omnitrophica bacterium]|nr:CpaF family protein [Candidatus Omnitrophota bacterium]
MTQSDAYEQVKRRVKMRLAEALEVENGSGRQHAAPERAAVELQVRQLLAGAQRDVRYSALSPEEQTRLIYELTSEVTGAGPLQPLIDDPAVTEIMVNGPHQVFVERHGKLERADAGFKDTTHLMSVIERLLDAAGLNVTKSDPCVDASLPDGTRLNIVIPPLVLNGPTVTIRKKARDLTMDDWIANGSLTPLAADFLAACVKAKVNFIISGGTSTGKTTIVSILSSFMPQAERIITIENVAELELPNREHWIRLVGRSANLEGRGEISLRMLVRNALRMRPDRIILGEARGGEALDVVQAMHTGHEGVITILHGNSPQAALERLQTMMLMSGLDLPPQVCQMQIASAVDVVVHLGRFADGSRRVTSIAQLPVVDTGGFELEELFHFDVRGFRPDGTLDGELRYTGMRPKFIKKFQLNNIPIPGGITA